jgi:hypothetical protein
MVAGANEILNNRAKTAMREKYAWKRHFEENFTQLLKFRSYVKLDLKLAANFEFLW